MTTSIDEQLEAACAELNRAAAEGEDTALIRKRVAELEQKQRDEAAEQRIQSQKKEQEAQAELAAKSEKQVQTERSAIERAANIEGLAEVLADGDAPAGADEDPQFERAISMAVAAQDALDKASARQHEAQAKVDQLQNRIGEKEARKEEILAGRLGGNEDGAAELYAIDLDLETLRGLSQNAQLEANNLTPARERAALSEALAFVEQVRAKQRLAVLEARARQAEAVLVRAHTALVDAAMAAGATSRFSVFKPSNDLKFIVQGTL